MRAALVWMMGSGLVACGGAPEQPGLSPLGPADAGGPFDSGSEVDADSMPPTGDGGAPEAYAPDGQATNRCAVAFAVAAATSDYDLYALDPSALPDPYRALTRLGRMTGCGATPAIGSLTSVAVDVSGTMWLSYANGAILRSPTSGSLSCADSGFVAGQWGFGTSLRLSFGPSSRGTGESLYVFDPQSVRMAEVDTSTLSLRPMTTGPTPHSTIFSFSGAVWMDANLAQPMTGYDSSLQGLLGGGPVPLPNFLAPSKMPMFGLGHTFYFVLYNAPPSADQIVLVSDTTDAGAWTTNPPRDSLALPVRILQAAVSSCAH